MTKPQIPVTPKLIYSSKSFIGAAITAASIVLPSLAQQSWISPEVAKLLTTAGGACGVALTLIGTVDRPETFFSPGKLREAAEQAASNLTIVEAAHTIEQGVKVLQAPAAEKPGLAVDFVVDLQRRLSNQDAMLLANAKELAEIRAATTAQQFPPLTTQWPERDDLPHDPRQRAQMEAPPVRGWKPEPTSERPSPPTGQTWESDVTQTNGEGVLENY